MNESFSPENSRAKKGRHASNPNSNLNTKMRLILAAADCFAEHGFEGTSTRDIAKRADVAQQLITYHFGTKEDLWKATVSHLLEEYTDTGHRQEFDETKDKPLVEQFREHLITLITGRLKSPQIQRIVTQEFLSGTNRYHDFIAPRMEEFGRIVVRPYFKKLIELGIAPQFTVWEISQLVSNTILVNVINPDMVKRYLDTDLSFPDVVEKQADLIIRLLTGNQIIVEKRAPKEHDATAENKRLEELENLVVELSLENRRLRGALKKDG